MSVERNIDINIAKLVFGNQVKETEGVFLEENSEGTRELAKYSTEMAAAWEVVEKMNITILPIENDEWFALVGSENKRWSGPAEFMRYLQAGEFVKAGAAVANSAALTVCLAALKAIEHRAHTNLALGRPSPAEKAPTN